MAEYIEREALKLKVQRYLMPNVDADGTVLVNDAERYFLKLLDDAPTADVVEVVRCKNCIHRDKRGICEKFRQRYPFFPEDDFYCDFGAKMDGKEALKH